MGNFPDMPSIPWGSFGPQLSNLAQATANKLEREWPERYRADGGAQALFEMSARFVSNSFHTIQALSLDDPPHPLKREDALAVTPISRSILDVLFTITVVLEDVPAQSRRYFKAGWRENAEELARHQAKYGTNPSWQKWLAEFQAQLATCVPLYEITQEEQSDPSKIPYWPIPGRALKDRSISAPTRDRLQYLNDWFYKSLSAHIHVSMPGLVMRTAALLPTQDEEHRRWLLGKQISDQALVSSLLVLAFVSEIELHFHFGLAARIQYVWGILKPFAGMALELSDPWYSERLALLGA